MKTTILESIANTKNHLLLVLDHHSGLENMKPSELQPQMLMFYQRG